MDILGCTAVGPTLRPTSNQTKAWIAPNPRYRFRRFSRSQWAGSISATAGAAIRSTMAWFASWDPSPLWVLRSIETLPCQGCVEKSRQRRDPDARLQILASAMEICGDKRAPWHWQASRSHSRLHDLMRIMLFVAQPRQVLGCAAIAFCWADLHPQRCDAILLDPFIPWYFDV
jgi:hypothetical protein